jgi:hypothetical protein
MPSIVHIFTGGERKCDEGATILYHNYLNLVSAGAGTEIRTRIPSNNSSNDISNNSSNLSINLSRVLEQWKQLLGLRKKFPALSGYLLVFISQKMSVPKAKKVTKLWIA